MDVAICKDGTISTETIQVDLTDKIIPTIINVMNTESFDIAIRRAYQQFRDLYFNECNGFISSYDQETFEIMTLDKNVNHTREQLNLFSLFSYTVNNSVIYISNQPDTDDNIKYPPGHIHIRNVITVPLKHQRIVGLICMANKSSDFTVHDAQVLDGIAKVLSVYMWNYLEVKQRDMSLIQKLNTSIRTPMMSIIGSTGILKRLLGKPDKDVQNILSIVEMSVRNVTDILEDIVYYSELTTNHINFKNQNFKLSELISETVYETKEKKNEINYTSNLLQDSIYTDRKMLKYILTVLINNANMYTDNGRIIVSTSISPVGELEPSSYQTATLQIKVQDNGVGIPYQNQGLVFNEFYRGVLTTDNQYTTGLKLPICKRICNRLNGDMSVVSNILSGTTFTAEVEVKLTPDTNYIMEHYGTRLRKGSVLVIQNNVEARINIYNAYMSYEIPVYLCSSVRDVYEFARLHAISLIITDTNVDELKAELDTRNIHCQICSTRRHLSSTSNVSKLHTYDTKNFDSIDLLLMTLNAVNSQENSPLCTSRIGNTDRSVLAVEDNPDNLYMLTQMLYILGYNNVTTATDGGEALNLLLRNSYDVVLLDNIMPGMTGIEVAAEFGNICKEPLSYFAIISAGITDTDTTTLHSVGVTHTLMKPYGLEELRTLLDNI